MTGNDIDGAAAAQPRPGGGRVASRRQNLMVATLLAPLAATMTLAAAKVALRHHHAPMSAAAEAPTAQRVATPTPVPTPMVAEVAVRLAPPNVALPQAPPDPRWALAVNEARLRRDAGDIEARTALVASAIAAGQADRADLMARQALQQSPSEPRAWIAAASVANARGDRERARHDLARARDLRMQQLGYSDNGDDDSTLAAVTLAPGDEPYRGRPASPPRWTPPSPEFARDDADLAVPPAIRPLGGFGAPMSLAPPALTNVRLDTRPVELAPPAFSTGDTPAASSTANPFAPVPLAIAASNPADAGAVGVAGNPFRAEPGGGLSSGTSLAPAGAAAVTDPMTQQIDREIAALDGQLDPAVQAGFGFRVRSGTSGLSKLTELAAPLEGEFSPGGYGRLKVSVTPTFLIGGKLGTGIASQQQFGAGAFGQATARNQNAQGTALNVAYAYDTLSGDVGSTPLGFPLANVVGGAQWAPKLSDSVTLRVIGERRAITDSLLSFAGARDPTTGTTWGGVTRTRGRVNIEVAAGLASFYVGAGGGVLTGTHVQRNTEREAGAGASYPVYKTATQEVRVGLDFVYLGFQRNEGGFTLGQGGYFSPRQFFAAIVPITYREKVSEDLTYEVGGSVGVQNVRNKSSLYYPIDPTLQSALAARQGNAGSSIPGVGTVHGASHDTGIAGGAHALIDYAVNPSLHLGAKASIEHVGDYTEGSGLVYARYIFNKPGQ